MADRIGRARIAGERKGLAAATAEIDVAAGAAFEHGSGIQAVPRKALKAGEFFQMSASE